MQHKKRYGCVAVCGMLALFLFFAARNSGGESVQKGQGEGKNDTTHAGAFEQDALDKRKKLPAKYDMRQDGRAPQVKNQGEHGTCWAFAALTALESSLLPDLCASFSADHMNEHNSFHSLQEEGGQYTMAMAYLAGWQGPVEETDGIYGGAASGQTPDIAVHVQEMQIIEAKDMDGIKEAVYEYGGVESCIYTTMQGADGPSEHYNRKESAYCYEGDEKPNHDIVIIGWDDYFPKESFLIPPQKDGAFICQNSWGEGFGEGGVFYVSYYDSNIGVHNLVYTQVEDNSNYDYLYQADLCGWVGQIGYRKESIYGANVYTPRSVEEVVAAGFYTTGKDTEYEVFIVPDFTGVDSFAGKVLAAQGKLEREGYYTVRFAQGIAVEPGKKFAVVLRLSTPGTMRPLAIEYAADELTQDVDLGDGEGYISPDGERWADVREVSECNLCIKAYTREAAAR